MDSEIGSIDMNDDMRVDAISYSCVVDNAIRSDTASDLGASPVRSFGSIVDSAIRSDTASNFGASPGHGFASAKKVRSTIAARSSKLEVMSNATGHDIAAQLFSLAKLKAATNNFSVENKIGAGSYGAVYKGQLVDGREVAIKRAETWSKRKEIKEIPFQFLLAFLSRLHHNHLVGLVGLCEEKHERSLVYEYMRNGSLYDCLHRKRSSVLNSWGLRIKIALDASRGIQYLHNYADPCIIHGDIKSCNILLDASWSARISDSGLTFMKNTAGTVGYIDPEYYDLNEFTANSDVYGLGVVLLELLTGKKAIFRYGEGGATRVLSVLQFAVPAILGGKLVKVLDPRIGTADVNQAKALKLVAYTALYCVKMKGKDRPTMTNIVINLERALAICYKIGSHDSISMGTVSRFSPIQQQLSCQF